MVDVAHDDPARAMDAARLAYDGFADTYADMFRHELDGEPYGRAMLDVFAERVREGGGGRVADVGCGTGRITGHLRARGLDVVGIDLSFGMVTAARRDFPALGFAVGSLTAIPLPDASLAGVLAWYSLIHVPPELLPVALAELHRVTAPGGRLIVGFQIGDGAKFVDRLGIDFQRLQPDRVAAQLEAAGFAVDARLTRTPAPTESSPQGVLQAHRPLTPP